MTGDQATEELHEAARQNLLERLAAETDPGRAEQWANALADLGKPRRARTGSRIVVM